MEFKSYSYGKQCIEQDDIDAVTAALQHEYLTQGPEISSFESDLSRRFGAKHVIVVNSGTAALHLACMALGIGPGDEVLVPTLSFAASANCALYCGASVTLMDVDPITGLLTPEIFQETVLRLSKQGRRPKALIAVDYAGQPCDWKNLRDFARAHGMYLIGDGCHALGAKLNGDELFSARFADVVCSSFHPVKHITTGEGGAAFTNDDTLAEKIRDLRTHGITRSQARMRENHGPWYYEMQSLGFNYRITDMQAALGRSQLRKLDRFLERRQRIATLYREILRAESHLTAPEERSDCFHAYHLFPVLLSTEVSISQKQKLFIEWKKAGLNLQVHYIPIHLQPYYRELYPEQGSLAGAESFYRREVSLPIHPGLNDADISEICDRLLKPLRKI